MGAFKKSVTTTHSSDVVSLHADDMYVVETKKVKSPKTKVHTTYIKHTKTTATEYAKKEGLPSSEDYKLETMLAAGVVPEDVPVRGLLDSHDSLDHVDKIDDAYLQLSESVPSKEPIKAPEPTPTNEPEPVSE